MERTYRRALAILTLAVGVSLGGATMASAAPKPADPPPSGDPRATSFDGNATTCAGAGLAGEKISVTFNITDKTYIDITAVPAGYTVTGVVVKGGDGYNRYPNLGALPWNDLHAPLVASGKPAEISHWYVCAKKKPPTTTTTTKTTTTTTTKTTTTTSPPTSTTSSSTTSSGGGGVTTTTTSVQVSQASKDKDLASTGFNGGWFVLVGAGLLLGGGALLIMARMRRRS